ncbi:hypothetical protein D8674_024505 [Pyrus ussuriensis x Pyrus communis]|uniref:Uncharacterized protein n=1 Tax=Pyrus ussuriensis x Pyrus communis TaxID=2448454 RepID=A0A5N5H6X6_9ROSA|nr:hypothetical protein D8674_024505 [Pyrus ussuriensis x Pyrus communis]
MALAIEVKHLQGDTTDQSFEKPPSPNRSVGLAKDTENDPEDTKLEKFPTLPQGYNMRYEDLTAPSPQPDTSTGEQKLPPGKYILDGELGEDQIVYLGGSNDTEVNEHNGQNEEGVDVNELAGPSDFEPLLDKKMRQKHKEMQLVHHFTHFQSYKRSKVGDSRAKGVGVVPDPIRIIPKPDVEVFIDIVTSWAHSPSDGVDMYTLVTVGRFFYHTHPFQGYSTEQHNSFGSNETMYSVREEVGGEQEWEREEKDFRGEVGEEQEWEQEHEDFIA